MNVRVPRAVRRRVRSLHQDALRVAGWLAAATPVLAPILLEL